MCEDDSTERRRISVVGVLGDRWDALGERAVARVAEAELVGGGARLLRSLDGAAARGLLGSPRRGRGVDAPKVDLVLGIDHLVSELERARCRACVLASGDPGFFGIVRKLGARLGAGRLEVHPGPSSVAVAFARLGLPWDDVAVVSAHGRPLGAAADAARRALGRGARAAVLCSPGQPPEAVATAVGDVAAEGVVCSRLGCDDESVTRLSLSEIAAGRWDGLSVLVLEPARPAGGTRSLCWERMEPPAGTSVVTPAGTPVGAPAVGAGSPTPQASLRWGLADTGFAHRDGMVTKAEVRAVVLSKLGLPSGPDPVMWDVGAGSGSVGIEWARLAPSGRVIAIERDPAGAARIAANASAHGVEVGVVVGEAPEALGGLPTPAAVFVGGGGLAVLDAVLVAAPPGTPVVAAYASLDHAAQGGNRLGSLTQVAAARGVQLPGGHWRLEGTNPVFVAWGSAPGERDT
ncbi:MAG: precorrin-6y C5,15-methyltransferase (decarboxylating) subunit CbiE [Actinomycetota bacterium]|nr:precorrin-6y C5,15-methyltransferase (decarboxylating) subunit CbiE [Actinomycetota bacterium]